MNRPPVLPFALFTLLLVASAPASAKAFKCVVDGKTVYQDHPCAGPAPTTSVAAPAAAAVPAPRAQLPAVELFDEIQMKERHQRELAAAYQLEAKLAEPRLRTLDAKARQAETQQMQARWQPRMRAQQQELERLKAELKARCPGGASMRDGHFECAP
jgi:hypothetical protein